MRKSQKLRRVRFAYGGAVGSAAGEFSDAVTALVAITLSHSQIVSPASDIWSREPPLRQLDYHRRLERNGSNNPIFTIGVFTAAAVIALRWPVVGMALICLCLVGYLRLDIPAPKEVAREEH